MTSFTFCFAVITFVLGNKFLFINGAPAPDPVASVEGAYELTSDPGNPDFAEYLQALGVSEPFRQVMSRIKINIEVKKTDVGYKYKVITPILTRETSFKFGEELDDTYVDGRKYKTTFTFDGETVKQELKFENVTGTNVYKFTPDGLIATLTANDKSAIRTYKRTQ